MTVNGGPEISEGRAAFERCDWPAVFAALRPLYDDVAPLPVDDLERLAVAATWMGEWEVCIGARERAFAFRSESGEKRAAAVLAIELCLDQATRRRDAVAMGWFERANELLEDAPPCSELARLEDLRAIGALFVTRDLETAAVHARRAVSLSQQLGDRDTEAVARGHLAQILIRQGDVVAGTRLLDQAMTAAVSGELGPVPTARVYCMTISMCQALGDIRRAREWTEEAIRCSSRPGLSDWPGDCRLHRAELTRMEGDWLAAETEIERLLPVLETWDPDHVALAWHELGEIRRRRGDFDDALEAFTRAKSLGRNPQPGLALLHLARGEAEVAEASIDSALVGAESDPPMVAQLLPAAVAVHLARGHLEEAASAALQLSQLATHCPTVVVQAAAAQAAAEVALARQDPRTAVSAGRQAVRLWRDAAAPYEAALAQMVVARGSSALGDAGVARVELETARAAFEALGAAFDVTSAAGLLVEVTDVVDRGRRVCRTFLFTDIVDSTRLVAAMGDEQWTSVLGWHDKTVRQLLEAHGGEEVKQRGGGDGFFATFPGADAAIACAVALQRAFADHRREYGFAPYVRVGVHEAEVTLVGRDYSGRGVHEAARVTDLAGAGEIVASAATATGAGWAVTSPPELVPLRGLPNPVEIVRVVWDSSPV